MSGIRRSLNRLSKASGSRGAASRTVTLASGDRSSRSGDDDADGSRRSLPLKWRADQMLLPGGWKLTTVLWWKQSSPVINCLQTGQNILYVAFCITSRSHCKKIVMSQRALRAPPTDSLVQGWANCVTDGPQWGQSSSRWMECLGESPQ